MLTKFTSRSRLGLALATSAALVVPLLGSAFEPAAAKPAPRPGNVTGLAASATKPGAAYRVHATWNAATNATSYKVTLSNSLGTTLDKGTVTDTAFTGTADVAVNATVKVTVVAFNTTRRGKAASKALLMPDLTAPVAAYQVVQPNASNGDVTIEQSALSDDLSQPSGITQSISWGDATPDSSGPGTQTSFAHSYGPTKAVYYPVVTVSDAKGNTGTYQLTVVVADTTAPTGSYSANKTSAWARWTTVTVKQLAIADDLSQPGNITQTIDWGDGTVTPWTGTLVRHQYSAAGSYAPTVTLTDEAGNASTPITTSAITVKADTVAPTVRLVLPKPRTSVRSWRTMKGRAGDVGTGVATVRAKLVEKRATGWYAYHPKAGTWQHVSSKAVAWKKAGTKTVKPTATRTWSMPVRRLSRGLLLVKFSAVDHVGNVRAWQLHQQQLTRP